MKVAHVGGYKPGAANGVNQTIAGLTEHLPAHGVEVELWHFTPNVRRVTERAIGGVNVFDVPCYGGLVANSVFLTSAAKRFLRERMQTADAVHLHSVFVPHNVWVARLGIPCVLTPNGGYGARVLAGRRRHLKKVWVRLWERDIWRRCRLVHAVSPPELEELGQLLRGVPIRYLPNGVGEALTRREVVPADEGDYFLFLGRLAIEHKGLDLLVRGYYLAMQTFGRDLPELVIAGPDLRGGRGELERLVKSLGLTTRVHFLGAVHGEKKWKLLGEARCFVHPSRWEGLPFALLEALALGRPVLITPGTNLSEDVAAFGCGWVVDPSPESVAAGLTRVMTASPLRLRKCGANARRLVSDRFTWSVIASKMAETYAEIVR